VPRSSAPSNTIKIRPQTAQHFVQKRQTIG
jgi:hypothetical protein